MGVAEILAHGHETQGEGGRRGVHAALIERSGASASRQRRQTLLQEDGVSVGGGERARSASRMAKLFGGEMANLSDQQRGRVPVSIKRYARAAAYRNPYGPMPDGLSAIR